MGLKRIGAYVLGTYLGAIGLYDMKVELTKARNSVEIHYLHQQDRHARKAMRPASGERHDELEARIQQLHGANARRKYALPGWPLVKY